MKLHYYPETDSLYIELKSGPGTEAREIVKGLVVDFEDKGEWLVSTSTTHQKNSTCPLSRPWPCRP
jgi:uncharacterized protein YuzE